MTRKDYVTLAAALRLSRPDWSTDPATTVSVSLLQWRDDRERIADALQADNPRFDRTTFYAATEA